MTLDALLNMFLITYFAGVMEIIAASNIGYVFATCSRSAASCCCARTGQLAAPVPPVRAWVPICAVLCRDQPRSLVAGGFIYSGGFLGITGYGYGWDKTRMGLLVLLAAFLLYVYRHVVQDRSP